MQFSAHLTATAPSSSGRRNRAGIAPRPLASIECVYWPVNTASIARSLVSQGWHLALSLPVWLGSPPEASGQGLTTRSPHLSPQFTTTGILHPDSGSSNTNLGVATPRVVPFVTTAYGRMSPARREGPSLPSSGSPRLGPLPARSDPRAVLSGQRASRGPDARIRRRLRGTGADRHAASRPGGANRVRGYAAACLSGFRQAVRTADLTPAGACLLRRDDAGKTRGIRAGDVLGDPSAQVVGELPGDDPRRAVSLVGLPEFGDDPNHLGPGHAVPFESRARTPQGAILVPREVADGKVAELAHGSLYCRPLGPSLDQRDQTIGPLYEGAMLGIHERCPGLHCRLPADRHLPAPELRKSGVSFRRPSAASAGCAGRSRIRLHKRYRPTVPYGPRERAPGLGGRSPRVGSARTEPTLPTASANPTRRSACLRAGRSRLPCPRSRLRGSGPRGTRVAWLCRRDCRRKPRPPPIVPTSARWLRRPLPPKPSSPR